MSDYKSHQMPKILRDRDIIQDSDGRIFIVLGYIQPENHILSFFKYVQTTNGRWESGGMKYERLFWGGVDSVETAMAALPDRYLIEDSHFGSILIEVPRDDVKHYFSPQVRLKEIIEDGPKDRLEELSGTMAETLHQALGVPINNLGVAGSIAWKGHNLSHSDINMNIYGYAESWQLHNSYDTISESYDHLRLRSNQEWEKGVSRVAERIQSLTRKDIETLFSRRRALYCHERCIGVTPILMPEEAPIVHGTESYVSLSQKPIRTVMEIENNNYGIFHPALYEGISEPLELIQREQAVRIMVYDGAFGGLFYPGDRVEVVGTLQRVDSRDESSESFYQIMVGTKEGAGIEHIRLLNSNH